MHDCGPNITCNAPTGYYQRIPFQPWGCQCWRCCRCRWFYWPIWGPCVYPFQPVHVHFSTCGNQNVEKGGDATKFVQDETP